MTMLDKIQEMFNKTLGKIVQRSFGRGEFCEFSTSVQFGYSESTFWTGSDIENDVVRERERLQKYKEKSKM